MQIEFFSKVKDPRVLGKVRHELEDVLRIALIGVLCSCEDYDEISDLIEDSQQEFKDMGFLRLTNGVPSGDTIRRVLEAVNPDQIRSSLAVCRDNVVSSLKGCHVIIDGKNCAERIRQAKAVTAYISLMQWSPIMKSAWQRSALTIRPMN